MGLHTGACANVVLLTYLLKTILKLIPTYKINKYEKNLYSVAFSYFLLDFSKMLQVGKQANLIQTHSVVQATA